MNDYIEARVTFSPAPADDTPADILAYLLADEGYESFVNQGDTSVAYIRRDLFSPERLDAVIASFPVPGYSLSVSTQVIEGQDWNAEWERNYFKPIVVGGQCVIHSSFHTDIPSATYDIVIDPKMAFGTGHHATTSLIVERLVDMDLAGKAVTDMGTGTGILAILAAMRGASPVSAVEIDPPAWENAVDNVKSNNHPEIDVRLGDASLLPSLPLADLFIANINRNIITADLPAYVAAMKPGATLLLSGFYEQDIPVVMAVASPLGLSEINHFVRDRWTCLMLRLAGDNSGL